MRLNHASPLLSSVLPLVTVAGGNTSWSPNYRLSGPLWEVCSQLREPLLAGDMSADGTSRVCGTDCAGPRDTTNCPLYSPPSPPWGCTSECSSQGVLHSYSRGSPANGCFPGMKLTGVTPKKQEPQSWQLWKAFHPVSLPLHLPGDCLRPVNASLRIRPCSHRFSTSLCRQRSWPFACGGH